LDATAFVFATTGAIDIEKTRSDFANVVTGPSKNKNEASFGMLTQALCQFKPSFLKSICMMLIHLCW